MKTRAWWVKSLAAVVLAITLSLVPVSASTVAASGAIQRAPNAQRGQKGKRAAKPKKAPVSMYQGRASINVDAADPSNLAALRRGIKDLAKNSPNQYPRATEFLNRLGELEKAAAANPADPKLAEDFRKLRAEALLANPLLDFNKLLLVKRRENKLGLAQNWQGNCALPKEGYDNQIALLDMKNLAASPRPIFTPPNSYFVGDVDLHFDAGKMLFSMPGSQNRWQIWEMGIDAQGTTSSLRQATLGEEPDVDNYDACYLPNGRIMFDSTRCLQGVPCVGGGNTVANLCVMDADGKNVRMLCFDQDHDWCPTLMNNGRILYTRWEYSDTPHYFTRLLFQMNPDGTGQREFYKSNSFWPNSTFYARPIPGSSTKVVAIASGHHGVPRMGELIVFDAAKGRREADGVVQRIPGFGQPVLPIVTDQLVAESWPKFLHPYPLSDKYFLVSCKPAPEKSWGLYLVDTFDNIVPLCEAPGYALLEPVPLRKTAMPPAIPDAINPAEKESIVYLQDIYRGDGLKGVPRGTVKSLRLFEFYYAYPHMGGHKNVGVEGPWDVHRILGTVPVQADGSASFKVPANTPIALQPLDGQGRALQVMRSWFTAMPGEKLSCVGCHEQQNMAPPAMAVMASRQAPESIKPWYGPARGFSFKREVQPVLDQYCVGCHSGMRREDGRQIPNFTAKDNAWMNFGSSYLALHPYVRRPGPESDYHMLKPLEYHAGTSELIQMLEKGHHGVKLDAEAMDRLVTWIDLNVPDKGNWSEDKPIPGNFHQRRIDMLAKYANRPEDPEVYPEVTKQAGAFVMPMPPVAREIEVKNPANWPMTAQQAETLQKAAGPQARRTIDLGDGVTLDLALIPAGEFVMGDNHGAADESPLCRVKIDKPFWMGVTEVTNAQYNKFDPAHDSRYIDQHHKDHTTAGYPANAPAQPVIRVTWKEAMAFCQWMSRRAGQPFTLPSEAQWEWACRAGAATPFWFGGMDTDFSKAANLADFSMQLFAVSGVNPRPIPNPNPYEDFLPKDARFDDRHMIECAAGEYQPNPWGLCDMHGNVSEWTCSLYKAYPYQGGDGREDLNAEGKRVARGGSWTDRPFRATSAYRLAYEAWQPVHDVGFRVICPAEPGGMKVVAERDGR